MATEIENFMSDLQEFLDKRRASIFFGEYHGEVWANGERIGAVTHIDGGTALEIHQCDC